VSGLSIGRDTQIEICGNRVTPLNQMNKRSSRMARKPMPRFFARRYISHSVLSRRSGWRTRPQRGILFPDFSPPTKGTYKTCRRKSARRWLPMRHGAPDGQSAIMGKPGRQGRHRFVGRNLDRRATCKLASMATSTAKCGQKMRAERPTGRTFGVRRLDYMLIDEEQTSAARAHPSSARRPSI